MKSISVILPINNPDILSQQDLQPYQSADYHFNLTYVDTVLRELNTAEDVAAVEPLVLDKIIAAERAGAAAVIVYAFGDVQVKEGKERVSIPVLGLGKSAIHLASMVCQRFYTVIPGQLIHNSFIDAMVKEEDLQQRFRLADHAVCLNPAEIRGDASTLDRLISAASVEITEKNIDTFTLGCGSFIGYAKPLEQALRKRHNKVITVVDPISISFNIAMALS